MIRILVIAAIGVVLVIPILATRACQGPPKELKVPLKLVEALESFRIDYGRYPSNQEGLKALFDDPEARRWQGGSYLRGSYEDYVDRWGRPYVYSVSEPEGVVKVYSLGRDGQPKTEDDAGLWTRMDEGDSTWREL